MVINKHGSFYLRSSWGTKIIQAINEDDMIFTPAKELKAVDSVGLGRVMVKALRYWSYAAGLTNEVKVQNGIREEKTALFNVIELNDRYFQKIGSLLLLHRNLARNDEYATAWYWAFNEFDKQIFTKEEFVDALHYYLAVNGMTIKKNAVDKEFNCFKNTYFRRNVNEERKKTPCTYTFGITYDELSYLASIAAKQFKRIQAISIENAVIYCTVTSQSGYSDWLFSVDFNDWGHITGTYWLYSSNSDSNIPRLYSHAIAGLINDTLHEKNIYLSSFSDIINRNTDLGTSYGLNYSMGGNPLARLFPGKRKTIRMKHYSDIFNGEHLYLVISILREYGFLYINSAPICDINDRSSNFVFEVGMVTIDNCNDIRAGQVFYNTSKVIICYHDKMRIKMPFSNRDFKNKNMIYVRDLLQTMGFTNIHNQKIADLKLGLVIKDGAVENVLADLNGENIIIKGESYMYDTKLVIYYHTYK